MTAKFFTYMRKHDLLSRLMDPSRIVSHYWWITPPPQPPPTQLCLNNASDPYDACFIFFVLIQRQHRYSVFFIYLNYQSMLRPLPNLLKIFFMDLAIISETFPCIALDSNISDSKQTDHGRVIRRDCYRPIWLSFLIIILPVEKRRDVLNTVKNLLLSMCSYTYTHNQSV